MLNKAVVRRDHQCANAKAVYMQLGNQVFQGQHELAAAAHAERGRVGRRHRPTARKKLHSR
ncbi:hypothetical protein ACVBEH_09615 [Roseateles sp. GG27B]